MFHVCDIRGLAGAWLLVVDQMVDGNKAMQRILIGNMNPKCPGEEAAGRKSYLSN